MKSAAESRLYWSAVPLLNELSKAFNVDIQLHVLLLLHCTCCWSNSSKQPAAAKLSSAEKQVPVLIGGSWACAAVDGRGMLTR
jgi:hypothetical protein